MASGYRVGQCSSRRVSLWRERALRMLNHPANGPEWAADLIWGWARAWWASRWRWAELQVLAGSLGALPSSPFLLLSRAEKRGRLMTTEIQNPARIWPLGPPCSVPSGSLQCPERPWICILPHPSLCLGKSDLSCPVKEKGGDLPRRREWAFP